MNAGKYICVRVGIIKPQHELGENIVPWKNRGTESTAVGIDRGNNKEYGHSRCKENKKLPEIIPVIEDKP